MMRHRKTGGATLVELLVSLTIIAMVSLAVLAMVRAASSVNRVMAASITNEWEVESAFHRMVQQLRQCTSFTVPTGTAGGTAFSVVTQQDAANGYQKYNVSYALVTAADGSKKLQETDSRYGTSTLINGVQSFDVRTMGTTAPIVVKMTLTVGSNPSVTRSIKVTPRNQ
jgi:type II secretory pathway component PulJ